MFDSNRLLRLSGLVSRDEYKSNLLLEAKETDDVEEGVYEADDADVDDDGNGTTKEGDDILDETHIRRVIRKEIMAVLQEYRTADDRAFDAARAQKSLSVADNWASGRVHPPRKNKVSVRGIGHSRSFGGPGFM